MQLSCRVNIMQEWKNNQKNVQNFIHNVKTTYIFMNSEFLQRWQSVDEGGSYFYFVVLQFKLLFKSSLTL